LAARGGAIALTLLLLAAMAAMSEGQQTDAATRQYAAAVALQNRGVYDLAADEWQSFIKGHPSDPRAVKARHYLGICQYQTAKYDDALASFQAIIAGQPKFELLEASYLYLGVTQFALGRSGQAPMYDRALQTLQALVAKNPQGQHVPDALYYLGECQYARGRKDEAIRQYTQFLAKYSDHKLAAEATYALGVAQEESSQADAAAKTYDRFLARFPAHRLATEVAMRRGETLLASGNAAEAAKRFAAAAKTEGFALAEFATLRHADALVQIKDYAAAAAVYASIPVKFRPSQYADRARLSAGRSLVLAGSHDEAGQLLSRLVDGGGPAAAEAAHWLARSWLKRKRPQEALAVVQKALPQSGGGPFAAQLLLDQADAIYEIPQRRKESTALYAALAAKHRQDAVAPQALYMAAFSALEQGDSAAAVAHAKEFLATFRDHALTPDVLHAAAEGAMQSGDFAEADKLYRQLLRQYDGHADAESWKVRRVAALVAEKKYPEAIAALEPLVGQLRQPDVVAEARFLLGSSQLELKQTEAAIQSLAASLAAAPRWRQTDEVLLALAEAHRQAGDLEKAKTAASRLISEFPTSRLLARAHYRLGEYHWLGGDHAAAAREYGRVVQQWPGDPLAPHALHELGCAQLNQKDAAGADATLSSLLERYPRHAVAARAHYARGMARHQLKQYAPAVEDLQAMLRADPGSKDRSDARFLTGLCQIELKRYDAAIATLRGLLKEDRDYAAVDKVRYQLAWALKLSGKEDEANRAFGELLAARPDSPLAHEAQHNLGEFAYKGKDYSTAARAYYNVVQATDGTPLGEKASHKLGWCYYHLGNFVNARKTFGYQLKRYADGPLAADAAFMEAECLFKEESYAEALAAYERIKKYSSRDFEMLGLLHAGQAAGQLKQWPRSAELLTRCTRQFADAPNAPEALYELGWAQQNQGRRDEAVKQYEQVIAKTDREVAARAQFMIGEIQFENKSYSEAVRSFFKVAYSYSHPKWQADATYEAGRCFENLGKKTQAVKTYQELLDKYPESERVPLARQRLAELKGS
jgi:TolA-binding protein